MPRASQKGGIKMKIQKITAITLAILLMLTTAVSCVNLNITANKDEPLESISDEPPESDTDEPPDSTNDENDVKETDDDNNDDDDAFHVPDTNGYDDGIDIIPEYKIKQTLYQQLRADDDVLLARNEVYQPVFTGEEANVRRMNEVFENDLVNYNLEDFEYLSEAYNSREGYVYSEAQEGRVGGSMDIWEESFRMGQYISFVCYNNWDGLGAHGMYELSGRVFDVSNGNLLTIFDVLSTSKEYITEALYSEYIAYHSALGDGLDEMALGYENGEYNAYFEQSVKDQCGADAVFWLSDDGVHIYFHQYTFYYAIGASELVIPYDRSDLIKKPFAR